MLKAKRKTRYNRKRDWAFRYALPHYTRVRSATSGSDLLSRLYPHVDTSAGMMKILSANRYLRSTQSA